MSKNRNGRQVVSLKIDDEISHHIPDVGADYATLCGLDGGLAGEDGQVIIDTPHDAKIDCPQCKAIFNVASKYKKCDFT